MSGRQHIKQPSAFDLGGRNLHFMVALIKDGGSPEPRHLEAMLRAGKDQMMPAELLNHIADLLYNTKGGRPTKSKIEKEYDAWQRAEDLVAEIDTQRRAGCSLAKACQMYAKARGGKATKASIERQYWQALATVRERDANVDAARAMGLLPVQNNSVQDVVDVAQMKIISRHKSR
jgi:hypothetical protein